jgi:hypothetical protein
VRGARANGSAVFVGVLGLYRISKPFGITILTSFRYAPAFLPIEYCGTSYNNSSVTAQIVHALSLLLGRSGACKEGGAAGIQGYDNGLCLFLLTKLQILRAVPCAVA